MSTSNVQSDNMLPIDASYELDFPLYINELCYEASSYLSAAVQDSTDALIQIKSVDADIPIENYWDNEIIKEALTIAGIGNMDEFNESYTIKGETDNGFASYSETVVTNLYNNLEAFSVYSVGVEALVAEIEMELKEALGTDYHEFVDFAKGNLNINSLKSFSDENGMGKYLALAGKRTATSAGMAMLPAGMEVLEKGGAKALSSIDKKGILLKHLNNYLTGAQYNPQVGGKVPTTANKLVSSLGTAAFVFFIGMGIDLCNDEVNTENTIIHAAQAGVAVASSLAGTAVTTALATKVGGTIGSFAGPIGTVAGVVVSVVGNLIIDGVKHSIHYTSNDMPKDYTYLTADMLREQMAAAGYLGTSPKLGPNETESIYDIYSELTAAGADDNFMRFIEQKVQGFSKEVMSKSDYDFYNTLFTRFKNCFYRNDANAQERFMSEIRSSLWHMDKYDEIEGFVDTMFSFYQSDNPIVKDFFDKLYKHEILYNETFDLKYR